MVTWAPCRRPARRTEPLLGPRAAAAAERLNVHRLDIGELADAVGGAFAPVSRMLDAAEWRARVGAHILVDEARPGFELLRGDAPAAVEIRRQHTRTKAELARVGDADCVLLVF